MGLFDDQIEKRQLNDEIEFENSFMNMAGAVLGRKIYASFRDEKRNVKNAIDEILKYYHLESMELPANISDFDDQLEFLLRPHGIMRRNATLKPGWYKDAVGAMLGVKKSDNSVVALIPGKLGGYTYYDYDCCRNVKINGKNEDLFYEEVLIFYTTFPLDKITLKDVLAYCFGTFDYSDYFVFALAGLAATLVGMFVPSVTNKLFSTVIYSKDIRFLVGIAVFLICVSISSLLFSMIQMVMSTKITTKMNIRVEAAAIIRVLSLPSDFFRGSNSGELSTRIEYLSAMCDIMVNVLLQTSVTTIFSLVYIFQMAKYAPSLTTPAILILLATTVIAVGTTVLEIKWNKKRMEVGAKVSGLTLGIISGIQKIKLTGSEKRAFAKWGNAYAGQADVTYNYPAIIKLNGVINLAITSLGTIFLFYLAVKSGVSVADYFAFNAAFASVSGAFVALSVASAEISRIIPIIDMVKPIMDAQPEVQKHKKVLNNVSGNIEMSNVSFKYEDGDDYVLQNLSLKIRNGQYVAIVGKTGCGKSTLMRLLLGFEKPAKGAIYIDGKDIKTLDLKSLRKKIGVVMQNGTLFEGDIFSNISITNPSLTRDEAFEIAKLAGIDEDIKRMPMGMYTMVSEGGVGISGGQKQRLMIARALASKPRILMFDEATSALDNITQKKITESLKGLKCTRIVIAHRLSTIKDCDRIIVLDGGTIVEDGKYDDLIRKDGFFADLVRRQQIDKKDD